MTMHWWNWLTVGLALGWMIRSTVHWLGWIGEEGVRRKRERLGTENAEPKEAEPSPQRPQA